MSRPRRLLLLGTALVLGVAVAALVLTRVLRPGPPDAPVDQARPGPVLLVPGYGGSTAALEVLAQELREVGRTAQVVRLPGDGRGDLRTAAEVLDLAVDAALAAGAPSVDVVGYSAGGVVARLWAADGGAGEARRIVTLGSPHHGTRLASLSLAFAPGSCPLACQQLAPGARLLAELNADDETPDGPAWMSIWTAEDDVVTPPESARLAGAVQVVVQQVCPGARVDHGQLPVAPQVQAMVVQALGPDPLVPPGPDVCSSRS